MYRSFYVSAFKILTPTPYKLLLIDYYTSISIYIYISIDYYTSISIYIYISIDYYSIVINYYTIVLTILVYKALSFL